MLVFYKRHEIRVVLTLNDDDALASVPIGVRMIQDIGQVAALDVEDDPSNPASANQAANENGPEIVDFSASYSDRVGSFPTAPRVQRTAPDVVVRSSLRDTIVT